MDLGIEKLFEEGRDAKDVIPSFAHLVRVLSEGFHENMPNVLLFGSRHGLPHAVLWDAAVHARFGGFHRNECIWNKQWIYNESPYFFDIDLANPGQPKDISTLSDFLKEIAVHTCIHAPRHVFFLRNVDVVCGTKNGANMLRVMLERYSTTTWFVCSTYRMGALEPPIRSRFFTLRVHQPSMQDMDAMVKAAGFPGLPEACVRNGTRSLPMALLVSRMEPHQDRLPHGLDDICTFHAPFLAEAVQRTRTRSFSIEDIRSLTQELVAHGYSIAEVASDLLQCSAIRSSRVHEFLPFASMVDHMCAMTDGYRKALYMEWLIAGVAFDSFGPKAWSATCM